MSSPKIEKDTPHVQAPEVNATVQAKPEEVATFRAALAGSGAVGDGLASDDDMASSDEVVAFADAQIAPRAMSAAARANTWTLPSLKAPAAQAVVPKQRVRLGTHLARQSAMQPVADLLALVRQRAAGRAVPDLKIVPPEPNPLRLTLHLAMNGDEFVVKARTALGADRREEVQQALHVLETALATRLQMPARVVLLA